MAQKISKVELVFKGIQHVSNGGQLCFADSKNKIYLFNAQRSNTSPYVLYSTASDGSLNENEKIKGTRFLVSYTILKADKTTEKIITQVKLIAASK